MINLSFKTTKELSDFLIKRDLIKCEEAKKAFGNSYYVAFKEDQAQTETIAKSQLTIEDALELFYELSVDHQITEIKDSVTKTRVMYTGPGTNNQLLMNWTI